MGRIAAFYGSYRSMIAAIGVLLLAHAFVLASLGVRPPGPFLSDTTQLALGLICALTSLRAFGRSGNIARYYWRTLTMSFALWAIAQGVAVWIDLRGGHSLDQLDDVLFSVSTLPFGILLFLDPGHEPDHFDYLHVLDFVQVLVFWIAVYFFFDSGSSPVQVALGHFSWTRSVTCDGILVATFCLRARLTNSVFVREFFGRMALYLFFAGAADSYTYYPGSPLRPGQWFDLIWSLLLVIPLVIAATWNEEEPTDTEAAKKAHSIMIREVFPILFPFFSLLLLAHVALNHAMLAALLLVVCFVSSSARTLIIQHRHQRSEAALQRAKDTAESANDALIRAQQALQIEATHDALTELWNRRAIFDLLQKEVQRQNRIQGSLLGLMMADVDHFKQINDAYGHPVGDVVLQEVAKRLSNAVRTYDSVGRYGGEEFLVILPGCTASDLLAGGERLRRSLADLPVATSAGPIPVTISIGLVSAPLTEGDTDTHALLSAADSALYLAKTKGRNRVETLNLASGVRPPLKVHCAVQ